MKKSSVSPAGKIFQALRKADNKIDLSKLHHNSAKGLSVEVDKPKNATWYWHAFDELTPGRGHSQKSIPDLHKQCQFTLQRSMPLGFSSDDKAAEQSHEQRWCKSGEFTCVQCPQYLHASRVQSKEDQFKIHRKVRTGEACLNISLL